MQTWMTNPNIADRQGVLKSLYEQPAQFADVYGQNFGNYAQGMAGLGNAYANAFGAYGMGLGSMATARANEASARYGANAMAEAARQAGAANIGSAALGAFGGASNSALAAWAANQQAYNNAAASMHNANQQGLSQYGQSRNAALGSLGGAYAGLGKAQMASDALSNFSFGGDMGGGMGGGFSATGPSGSIASGSYGSGGGGSGFAGGGSRSGGGGMGGALSGLGGLQGNLMASDIVDSLNRGADAGRKQLDDQHYSSREMPSQMLGQTLSGLMTLGRDAYGQSSRGMDQFYANTQMDERPYQSMLDRLSSGYGTVGGQLGGVQRDMTGGYNAANQNVGDMWSGSLGRLPVFRSPLENAYDGQMQRIINWRQVGLSPGARQIDLLQDIERQLGAGGGSQFVARPYTYRDERASQNYRPGDSVRKPYPALPARPTGRSAPRR